MSQIPVGLQLYSVREDCAKDLPSVLEAVSDMGYDGVEFAGYHGFDAPMLRRMLDDNGLSCCGTHIGLDSLAADRIAETAEFHKTIGCQFLIVPWIDQKDRQSAADWLRLADRFNEASDRATAAGFRVGYHNHNFEFIPIDGHVPWDVFFSNTKPEVIMQFDTANALSAGANATDYLRRYPGRAVTVHLKEHSATNDKALLGEGDVPWAEVLELCQTVGGTQWYVVEQESYALPPMECVQICLKNLRGMLEG